MGGGVAHTTRKDVDRKVGKYSATPVTLADGNTGYLLTDSQGKIINLSGKYQATPAVLADGDYSSLLLDSEGRVISLLTGHDDADAAQILRTDGGRNLHITHAHGIQNISITDPGLAYVNGTNALCIAAPVVEANEVEIISIYLSTKIADDFYLVVDNLGVVPGSTTDNTFDLIGIFGDGITDTSDVVWAAFFGNQGKGATGGEFHFDCGAGKELYLIAPNQTYNIVVNWLEETV